MKTKALAILVFLFIAVTFQSCYKEPAPGQVKIIVVNEDKVRIPFAQVRIHKEDKGSPINETLTTDFFGELVWEFPLEVILDVDVKRDTQVGKGIIRVIPGTRSVEIITIY